jgi:hypothetical protein
MSFNRLSLRDKLLTKASPAGECLVWHGTRDERGYGFLRHDGRYRRAHRLMYELAHGAIPFGQVVRHRCDNPACIQLEHLMLGTQGDNVQDMWERGRARVLKGEANGRAKLTAAQAAEIRRRFITYDRTHGTRAMAREFGVSHASIGSIVRGETHKP